MAELNCVFLQLENHPEWFTLDFLPKVPPTNTPGVLIGIANASLDWLIANQERYSVREWCEKLLSEYGINVNFLADASKPWGFGGVLKPYIRHGIKTHDESFSEYVVLIPQVEKETGNPCPVCDGTGKDDMADTDCLRCSGTAKEMYMDWGELDCLAATLCTLGAIIDTPFEEALTGVSSTKQQLLSVRTNFERGRAFIGSVLASPFADYLRAISNQDLPSVRAAMKESYLRMFPGYKRFGDFGFQAHVRDRGQLILDVPGDACGLFVDGFSSSLREVSGPMELSCHNVDGHHQQLTLFVGLAALCGIVRGELYS